MSWRLALSLQTLRSECNALWPDRSKASDGTIGDAAHAASASDHNPNAAGVVCAFDLTHDPDHGVDIAVLFEQLRRDPHPDLKYLIANRRIASRSNGNFTSRPYSGADPHTNHLHASVGVGSDGHSAQPYDDTTSWFHVSPPEVPPSMAVVIARPDQCMFILHSPGHKNDGWIILGANGDRTATKMKNPEQVAFWQQYVPGPIELDVRIWDMLTITLPGSTP